MEQNATRIVLMKEIAEHRERLSNQDLTNEDFARISEEIRIREYELKRTGS